MPLPSSSPLRANDLLVHLKALRDAWTAAKEASQAAQDPNYEITVPNHLLDAILASSSSQETTEAWEAVNYYQKAFVFALQQVERETRQELEAFEQRAGLTQIQVEPSKKVYLS